jgi:hypothetical protein
MEGIGCRRAGVAAIAGNHFHVSFCVTCAPKRIRHGRVTAAFGRGTRFQLMRFLSGTRAMSFLSIVAIGWVTLNASIFTALLLRRPRPELRQRLLKWAVQGAARPPRKSRRRSQHSHA